MPIKKDNDVTIDDIRPDRQVTGKVRIDFGNGEVRTIPELKKIKKLINKIEIDV